MSNRRSQRSVTSRPTKNAQPEPSEAGDPRKLLDEIAEATSANEVAVLALPVSFLGVCLDEKADTPDGSCRVRYQNSAGEPVEARLQYLAGLFLRPGDEVLLSQPVGASKPVVIGCLAGDGADRSLPLPGGRKLLFDAEESSTVRLELADGNVVLEIDLATEVPTIRLPQKDLTLDLEGRLKIEARSIDLVSRLGNVNVKANDDFKVVAERVWLN
jgi:hypothetical protein